MPLHNVSPRGIFCNLFLNPLCHHKHAPVTTWYNLPNFVLCCNRPQAFLHSTAGGSKHALVVHFQIRRSLVKMEDNFSFWNVAKTFDQGANGMEDGVGDHLTIWFSNFQCFLFCFSVGPLELEVQNRWNFSLFLFLWCSIITWFLRMLTSQWLYLNKSQKCKLQFHAQSSNPSDWKVNSHWSRRNLSTKYEWWCRCEFLSPALFLS